jgi:hypothetical protein
MRSLRRLAISGVFVEHGTADRVGVVLQVPEFQTDAAGRGLEFD